MMSKFKKRARPTNQMPVVVVESHHHVLEHIHHLLRRRNQLLKEQLYMLHFDAHSDLACPMDIPVRLLFQPRSTLVDDDKNLYELMDLSSTGIAEWILPLALAANLRQVDWIRPPSLFEQFTPGEHSFHVGAWIPENDRTKSVETFLDLPDSARLRVDFDTPYYRDDAGGDSCVATKELSLRRTLSLRVADITAPAPPIHLEHWILDICLDYFCSLNPFLTDLEALSVKFVRALNDMFCHNILGLSRAFQNALMELLIAYPAKASDTTWFNSAAFRKVSDFFESPVQAQQFLSEVQLALDSYDGDCSKLIRAALEAIPYWTMPHNTCIPSHQELQVAIDFVCRRIRQQTTPPIMITMARSAAEGFTPASIVEDLQNQVLEAVHSLYECTCTRSTFLPDNEDALNCCLAIVYDYDEWEGSSIRL